MHIKWATDLRIDAVRRLGELQAKIQNGTLKLKAEMLAPVNAAIADTLAETSASKWIDGRSGSYDAHWLVGLVQSRMQAA